MSIFKQDNDKNQDIGGQYTTGGKINEIIDFEIGVEQGGNHGISGDCCDGVGISISGVDICTYIASNCPAFDEVSYNPGNQELTFTLQNGITDTVTISISGGISSVSTTGCITGDGTGGDPITLNLDPSGGLECGAGGLAFTGTVSASGISSVTTAGCITGDGTIGSPVTLSVAPSGGLVCGPSGLELTGTVAVSGISSVVTSGCVTGDGTGGNPVTLTLAPSGGLVCGPSGLAIDSTGCCDVNSYVNSDLPGSSPAAPVEPASSPVEGTVQEEVFNDGIIYWVYTGGGWVIDKQLGPFGAGVGVSGSSTSIDSFELGKAGTVSADPGTIADQHKRPFSTRLTHTIYDIVAKLGQAGTSDTTFQIHNYSSGGVPTLEGTFTLPSGVDSLHISGLNGTSVDPGGCLAEIVTVGSDAEDLNIVVWVETTPI